MCGCACNLEERAMSIFDSNSFLRKHQKPVSLSLIPISVVVYLFATRYDMIQAQNRSDDPQILNSNLSPFFLLTPQADVIVKLLDLSFHHVNIQLQHQSFDLINLIASNTLVAGRPIANLDREDLILLEVKTTKLIKQLIQSDEQALLVQTDQLHSNYSANIETQPPTNAIEPKVESASVNLEGELGANVKCCVLN